MNENKPIRSSTSTEVLVFTWRTAVVERGFNAAMVVLAAIRELGLSGRVEFLSGDLPIMNGYALCVCWERTAETPKRFPDGLWEALREAVGKQCQTDGRIELQAACCETQPLSQLRRQFVNQGTVPFLEGKPQALPDEKKVQSMWITMAINHTGLKAGKG